MASFANQHLALGDRSADRSAQLRFLRSLRDAARAGNLALSPRVSKEAAKAALQVQIEIGGEHAQLAEELLRAQILADAPPAPTAPAPAAPAPAPAPAAPAAPTPVAPAALTTYTVLGSMTNTATEITIDETGMIYASTSPEEQFTLHLNSLLQIRATGKHVDGIGGLSDGDIKGTARAAIQIVAQKVGIEKLNEMLERIAAHEENAIIRLGAQKALDDVDKIEFSPAELKARFKAALVNLSILRKQVEGLEAEKGALTTSAEEARSKAATAKTALDLAKQEVATKTQELERVTREVGTERKGREDAARLKENALKGLREAEKRANDKRIEAETATRELAEARTALEPLKQEKERLDGLLAGSSTEIDRLREASGLLQETARLAVEERDVLRERVESLTAELEAAKAVPDNSAEITKLQGELGIARTALAEQSGTAEALRTEKGALSTRLEETEGKLTAAEAGKAAELIRATEAEALVARLQTSVHALEDQNAQLQARVPEKVGTTADDIDLKVAEIRGRLTAIQQTIAELSATRTEKTGDKTEISKLIESLREQLGEKQALREKLTVEVEREQSRSEGIASGLGKLRGKYNLTVELPTSGATGKSRELAVLIEEIAQIEAGIAELAGAYHQLGGEIGSLDASIAENEAEMVPLITSIDMQMVHIQEHGKAARKALTGMRREIERALPKTEA